MMTNQLSLVPASLASESTRQSFDLFYSSLNHLTGKKVIFRTNFSKEVFSLQPPILEQLSGTLARKFSKETRPRQVIGIDSSCVLVGDTEDGSIFAGRVTTVLGSKDGIETYYRAGPIIFYLSYEWLIANFGSSIKKSMLRTISSDCGLAERFIRIYLERRAQIEASKSNTDAIVAVDGSLQRSSLESRGASITDVQRASLENSNELVGFSKTSSIREISNAINLLTALNEGSVYIDLTDAIRAISLRIGSNRVAAVKFSANSPVFRVDLSSSNQDEDSQVLGDLKASDVFFRGYPETLRMAHHLSVFDSSTISSIRSFLSRRYNLVEIPSDDLRATVLGKLV